MGFIRNFISMPVQYYKTYKFLIHRRLSFSLLVFLSCGLFLTTSSCEAKDPADAIMFSRNKLLTLVNKARQSGQYCGNKWYAPVKKVRWNDQLEDAAKEHSKDMYENNFFSHKGSNGQYAGDRL